MNSWSSLCSLFWGKTLNTILRNDPPNKLSCAERLVSAYCLTPSATDCSDSYQNNKCFTVLKASLPSNAAILYPLSLEEFMKGFWLSSTKFLVLDEHVCRNSPNFQFISQVNMVSRYLADGGRVILLLQELTKNGHELNSTSLWSMVNSSTSHRYPVEDEDSLWSWKRSTDRTGRHSLLIGDPVNTKRSSPSHHLVVISADAVDESNGLVLQEALSLLGVNRNCDNTSVNGTHEPSKSRTLYCMPLFGKHQETLELVRSVTSQTVRLLDSTTSEEARSLASGFSWTDYSSTLQTQSLGRMPVWAETMPSSWLLTEPLLARLSRNSGLLVASNLQDSGKGRGSNGWITPLGQAAFTFHLTVDGDQLTGIGCSQSQLMRQVVCTQHIVSLAILLTCRRLIGERLGLFPPSVPALEEDVILNLSYQGPEIRIKWPNDVYVVDSHLETSGVDKAAEPSRPRVLGKLAGSITKASTAGPERTDILVGCGINVANRTPTICLLDVIDQCQSPQLHQRDISIARVIAVFLNQLEHLIDRIRRTSSGLSWALEMYTQHWLHSDQVVEVTSKEDEREKDTSVEPCRCRIIGLDAYGFLKVEDLRDGSIYSLHPDGNSMDMMHGLIRPK